MARNQLQDGYELARLEVWAEVQAGLAPVGLDEAEAQEAAARRLARAQAEGRVGPKEMCRGYHLAATSVYRGHLRGDDGG